MAIDSVATCARNNNSSPDLTSINSSYLVIDTYVFYRLFWSFPSCLEAFNYCKSVKQIDITHLCGTYKGILQVAVTQDDNKKHAFNCICHRGRRVIRWTTFHIRAFAHECCTTRRDLFYFDRQEAIKGGFRAIGHMMNPPHAYHAYCIRHIFANFIRRFKNKEMQWIVVNASTL